MENLVFKLAEKYFSESDGYNIQRLKNISLEFVPDFFCKSNYKIRNIKNGTLNYKFENNKLEFLIEYFDKSIEYIFVTEI